MGVRPSLDAPCLARRRSAGAGAGAGGEKDDDAREEDEVSIEDDLGCFEVREDKPSSIDDFTGTHRDIRPLLDYSYHRKYGPDREAIQDRLIESLCLGFPVSSELMPWVVFTAGAMGAGKGFVTRWMHEHAVWNLGFFVKVDPDEIRHQLPEWEGYLRRDPLTAGQKTQKEAGCIAEILSYKALRARRNVIIDGSLRDAVWYRNYIRKLRRQFPGIRIMILHVVSDLEDVVRRAGHRAATTGRVVPKDVLVASARDVPRSVRSLARHADFVCRVHNKAGREPTIDREAGAPHPPASVPVNWDLVRKLWRPIDTDSEGEIDRNAVEAAISDGILTHRVVKTLDTNGDGIISKVEIMSAAAKAMRSGSMFYR